MSTEDKIDRILTELGDIKGDIKVLKDKSHTPLGCPLSEKINALQLREARMAGIFTTIGAITILLTNGITFIMGKLWK